MAVGKNESTDALKNGNNGTVVGKVLVEILDAVSEVGMGHEREHIGGKAEKSDVVVVIPLNNALEVENVEIGERGDVR